MLLLAAGLLILLSGVFLLREQLVAPHLKGLLIRMVHSKLGPEVRIGRINGNYFNSFVIEDLETVDPSTTTPLTHIGFKRLQIHLSWWSLTGGMDHFIRQSRVEIHSPDITLNLALQEEPDEPQPFTINDLMGVFPLPALPTLMVDNASLSLKDENFGMQMGAMGIAADPGPASAVRLDLQIPELSWNSGAISKQQTRLNLRLRCSPSEVQVEELSLGSPQLQLTAHVKLDDLPLALPISITSTLKEAAIELEGMVKTDSIQLDTRIHQLDIATLIDLVTDHPMEARGLISIQGNAFVPFETTDPFSAQLNLNLDNGQFQSFRTDRLQLDAALDQGLVHLKHLDVRHKGNRLQLEDVTAAGEPLLAGDLLKILKSLKGHFQLEVTDVPAIVCQLDKDCGDGIQKLPPHRLLLGGFTQKGETVLDQGSLTSEGNKVSLSSTYITWPAAGSLSDAAVKGGLSLKARNLAPLLNIFQLPAPTGTLSGRLEVDGSFASPRGKIRLEGSRIAHGSITLDQIDVKASGGLDAITIDALRINSRNDHVSGSGSIDLKKRYLKEVNLAFTLLDPGKYIHGLGEGGNADIWPKTLSTLKGNFKGALNISGPFAKPAAQLILDFTDIKAAKQNFGNISAQITGDKEQIRVNRLKWANKDEFVSLTGDYRFKSRHLNDVIFQASMHDIQPYLAPFMTGSLPVQGGVKGSILASGSVATPEATVELSSPHFRWGDAHLSKILLKASSSRGITVLEQLSARAGEGSLEIEGRIKHDPYFQQLEADLTTLHLKWRKKYLALKRNAVLKVSPSGRFFQIERLDLSGNLGRIDISGRAGYEVPSDLMVQVENLSGSEWPATLFGDGLTFEKMNATAQLQGSLKRPLVKISGTIDQLTTDLLSEDLTGRFDLEYVSGFLSVRSFDWSGAKGTHLAVTGTMPLPGNPVEAMALQPLNLSAKLDLPQAALLNLFLPEPMIARGSLTSEATLSGSWRHPTGMVQLKASGLEASEKQQWLPPGPFSVAGDLQYRQNTLNLKQLHLDSPTLTFDGAGSLEDMPAIDKLIQRPRDNLRGNVSFLGSLQSTDISWVGTKMPALRRVRGQLHADLEVKGPLPTPKLQLEVNLDEGELRPNADVPTISSLTIRARATEEAVIIKTLEGLLGGSPMRIEGSIQQFLTPNPQFDIHLSGENLLLYRTQGIRLRGDTDLFLKGPLNTLALSGTVALSGGRITQYIDYLSGLESNSAPQIDVGWQLFTLPDPPLRDMKFQVHIGTKNPLMVRNNLVATEIAPSLALRGTGRDPFLVGRIFFNNTRLRLPAGNLKFESGLVQFPEGNPDQPELGFIGTSRMLGYDINISIDGPLSEPVVTLSSLPPLTDSELLLLVIAGQTPSSIHDDHENSRQLSRVAAFLGRDLLMRWFADDEADSITEILDRFDVVVGRDITQTGDETMEASFRLTDNLFEEDDTLYITGEKDVYDQYNGGVRIVFRFK